jgi:hypothetical protein
VTGTVLADAIAISIRLPYFMSFDPGTRSSAMAYIENSSRASDPTCAYWNPACNQEPVGYIQAYRVASGGSITRYPPSRPPPIEHVVMAQT